MHTYIPQYKTYPAVIKCGLLENPAFIDNFPSYSIGDLPEGRYSNSLRHKHIHIHIRMYIYIYIDRLYII